MSDRVAAIAVVLCGLAMFAACSGQLSKADEPAPAASPAAAEMPAQKSPQGETTLPEGGGEPGKIWSTFDAAMRRGDVAAVSKLIVKSRVQDVKNELWKSFVMVEFAKFKNPVYVSGVLKEAGKAELRFKASETPPGRPSVRAAKLVMEDGMWKVAGWE